MSRVGKKILQIPSGVDIKVDGAIVKVKGPKGELTLALHPHVKVAIADKQLTVDVADPSWNGNVGVVTTLFPKAGIAPEKTVAFTCGPPIMIKFVIIDLLKMGFPPANIISTLERYMKCGVGKCGHCAIGHKYVCIDGPVFNYADIHEMGEE